MSFQQLDRVVVLGQFSFREKRMDFAVADGVQDRDRTMLAALQFGREVVTTLQFWRNFTFAQRADLHRGGP